MEQFLVQSKEPEIKNFLDTRMEYDNMREHDGTRHVSF